VEAAEQLRAFSQHFLHDIRVRQVQLDELFALLSAVTDGEVSEFDAIERLERSPHGVWVAMDPESKLLLALDVGDRTLAMAQRFVHHVTQVVAPDCAPLFLTDGFREYLTALLTHYGHWVQPSRRQDKGPAPKPRWMPLPGLLYAQVVKTMRRRRLVDVKHRVVFGSLEAVNHILAPLVGTSTQHSWSGSTSPSVSMSPRSGAGSARCARAKMVAAAVGRVPLLLQFLLAPHEFTPAPAPARAHQRARLGQAMAALYAGHGGGADRSCLDAARGAAPPCAAVATTRGGVSTQ